MQAAANTKGDEQFFPGRERRGFAVPHLMKWPGIPKSILTRSRIRNSLFGVIPLVIILYFGAQLRLSMLPKMGYRWDTYAFESWTSRANRIGLFNVYSWPKEGEGMEVNHPPIGVALLTLSTQIYLNYGGGGGIQAIQTSSDHNMVDWSSDYVRVLKYPVFISDLVLIVIGYLIAWNLAHSRKWLWAVLIGTALAFNPGLLIDSAWWGQTDVIFCLFLVLSVYALHRRRILTTWVCYALAILVKLQAMPLLPLLLAMSLRRSGLRKLLVAISLFAVVLFSVTAPFMIGSGFRPALRPYLDTVGLYPFVTIKAHNFWFWVLAPLYDMDAVWFRMPLDSQAMGAPGIYWGPISSRTVGLVLFGLCALMIMWRAWRHPDREEEFLLATALYMSFFMFSTQMQVRYLYPALVLVTFATINRPWVWLMWFGLSITVTKNILVLASHDAPLWQSLADILAYPQYQNALLNMIMLVVALDAASHVIWKKGRDRPIIEAKSRA